MREPAFCICEHNDADQKVTAQLISAFVFAIRIIKSRFYLNPKFQASSHLLWVYSPVCVRPGRKPRSPVSSQQGSNYQLGLSQKFCTATIINVSDVQL